MNIHALLQELGFSEYEARAYAALVGAGACNGYAVAKAAGMPRANVYSVLERLVERHAARRLDTSNGVRYMAVEPAELTHRLERQYRRTLAAAGEALATLEQAEDKSPVFNLQNQKELIDQARAVSEQAHDELLVAIQPQEAAVLAEVLREARERGVRIITLCMESCEQECGGCQGSIHRYNLAPPADRRWLLVVGDRQQALAGEIISAGATGVITRQRHIVELIGAYIKQSLALATLADNFGDRFEGLLSEHAQEVLDALHPDGGFMGRLAHMLQTEFG